MPSAATVAPSIGSPVERLLLAFTDGQKIAPQELRGEVEGLNRAQADELILRLFARRGGPEQAAPAAPPRVDVGEPSADITVAAAPSTSLLLPRGRFGLTLTRDGSLVGIAGSQRFTVPVSQILKLISVPKGDTVTPMTLLIAQLRVPLIVTKTSSGSDKEGPAYFVLQTPTKDWGTMEEFVKQLAQAAELEVVSAPSKAVFCTASPKPNQPNCAVKVRRRGVTWVFAVHTCD